ncbi:MAG: VOC family protein [Acidobacteriota bacterium]
MPRIESHEPGTFCWAELATSDGPAARRFYTELFGWASEDIPMGGDQVYTMLRLSGREVGAAYQMGADEAGRGVPPHWNSYVSVESADETAAKVRSGGGSVLAEPFDVMDIGRMAVLQDPAGAVLAVWEPRRHVGATLAAEPGAPCWYECVTRDPAAAARFYGSVFGWTTKQDPATAEYTELFLGGKVVGGMMPIAPEWGPVPSHWMVYIQVAGCDATVEKARAKGGTVRKPPSEIPGIGRFAILADPQGAAFSIIQLEHVASADAPAPAS